MAFFENLYLHGLNLMPQFGPKRLFRLSNHFQSFNEAFLADKGSLVEAGIEEELAEKFLDVRAKINLERELEALEKEGIKLLSFKDENYPELLKEISTPPAMLYYRGTMNSPTEACLAVVGTRKVTTYGRTVIPYLLEPVIASGVTIVSGLAYGVDSLAHNCAIDNKGRTIALLGSGIDDASIYPKDHTLLAKDIVDSGGAIVSEYPPKTPAYKQHFVARNRIISGISLGTLVVECGLKSGTLITAEHALEQDRQVFAVPGPIYSETSKGPNSLIRMGARPATEASDILSELNITQPEIYSSPDLLSTSEEKQILEIVKNEPIHIDTLIKISGMDTSIVTTTLTFLEIKGKIRNVGGSQYIRTK